MIQKKHIILVFLAASLQVTAQNEDQLLPTELKQLTAVTEPITLKKGFFRVGTFWSYTGYKSIFDQDTKRQYQSGSNIGRAQSIDLSLQYGLTDRIQINLALPYRMDKVQRVIFLDDPGFRPILLQSYSVAQNNYNEKGVGFGDLSASVFAQLFKESNYFPAISLRTTIEFPTGRKDVIVADPSTYLIHSAIGSGEFALIVDIVAKKIIYPYSFTFSSGLDYGFGGVRIKEPGGNPETFNYSPVFHTAGGINFHLNDWICLTNDIRFDLLGERDYYGLAPGDIQWRITYMPNINFQVKKLRLVQGISIPLKGLIMPADPSYALVVQYIF